MIKENYTVLGIMSGTSLDGIDICELRFQKMDKWEFEIYNSETLPYSAEWKNKLKTASELSRIQIDELDIDYTIYLAEIINGFISANHLNHLDAICSHGHTILHQPQNGFTIQIGNRESLSEDIKHTVVCDFRVQDVELGGQGAPLVPIGDKLLFSNFDSCVNLGGFANISLDLLDKRVAFDICAVNTVLNYYSEKLNQPYDKDGKLAANGNLNRNLYNSLNSLSYYEKAFPKSLGIEWVNQKVIPLLASFNESPQNILCTYTHHIAYQISNVLNENNCGKILFTGGGVYNSYLIDLIKEKSSGAILVPDSQLVEFKEALIFGLLGVLKLRGEVNCLSSVTGAKYDHSSGKIYPFEKQS
ncbi:MAG: anhydro-N-acetylmuramic acid kinase [bacterium]